MAAVLRDVIGDLLPAALAVALSPIPIVAVIVVLGTPRAAVAGPAFALGWVTGLAAVSTLVVAVLGGSGGDSDTAAAWLKLAIGVLFLGLAAQQWRTRPTGGAPAPAPAWMATLDAASPARTALLGAALSGANPKNVALTLAASATIAGADLDGGGTAVAVAAFVALGSVTVAGAVLFALLAGDRAARPLDAAKRFMADNNAVIMMVVLLLLGAKLIGDGLAGI